MHGDHSAGEEGVDVPRPVERGPVAGRVDVEGPDFAEVGGRQVLDLENAEAGLVVRLVDEVADDVLVVVDGREG